MKMQRYETLGMYVWDKPKTLTQKQYNEAIFAQAEAIRALRVQAVINEEFDFLDKEKMKGDFLAYFHKESTQRNSLLTATVRSGSLTSTCASGSGITY